MKFLLDTSTFLWITGGDLNRLSQKARQAVENSENSFCLSTASLWEIAIKYSLKRLELNLSPKEMVSELKKTSTLDFIGISPEHVVAVADLPFHHKDPFDRLLIAQAQVEGFPILTPDPEFRKYGIKTIW